MIHMAIVLAVKEKEELMGTELQKLFENKQLLRVVLLQNGDAKSL